MSFNIAVDGPAGAGKSTAARRAAKELSFVYVDTGAMYRAIALGLLRRNADPEDEAALLDALDGIQVGIGYEDGIQQVYLNGENVSGLIRTEEVGRMASRSSAAPQVRARLTDLQRELAAREDVLMDGRDIGTMILPHAQLKIYLTASVHTRALRRYRELMERGEACVLEEIERDIETRDYQDMHRQAAPLRQAEDAVRIDSSEMTIEEVTAQIVGLARARMEQCRRAGGRADACQDAEFSRTRTEQCQHTDDQTGARQDSESARACMVQHHQPPHPMEGHREADPDTRTEQLGGQCG